jgi:hypothetical protein
MIKHTLFRIVTLVAVIGASLAPFTIATAAPLTSVSDIMTRLRQGTLSNHTIKFVTPTGVTAGQTMTVTFPAGFTMGSFAVANVDLATGASCSSISSERTLAASPAAATWGVAQASQTITITSGTDTITAGHCVEIEIGSNATTGGAGTTQITNHATPATYQVPIGGTFADTGSTSVQIIADDQVVVTATVDQTLSFSISDNTTEFGSLGSGAVRYADNAGGDPTSVVAHNLIAGTNASGGYIITYNGTNLASGANVIDAATITGDADGTPGTEQFALALSKSGGSATIATAYAQALNNWSYVPTTTTTLVTQSAIEASTTYDVRYLANIATLTPAGAYTSTINYIATATF